MQNSGKTPVTVHYEKKKKSKKGSMNQKVTVGRTAIGHLRKREQFCVILHYLLKFDVNILFLLYTLLLKIEN